MPVMIQSALAAMLKSSRHGGTLAARCPPPLLGLHACPAPGKSSLASKPSPRPLSAASAAPAQATAAAAASARSAGPGPVAVVAPTEDLPFTSYTPQANAAYWSTRPVAVVKRLLQVGSALSGWLLTSRLGGADPAQRAEQLRRILTDLGPASIKIGQAVSSRPDVMPPDFLRELEKLQDRLPPFPTDQALAVLASDLGRPPSEVFSSISQQPVAAASLGQVYRAVLRRDGSQVAVKVQRPGVASSIALDVYVLRYLAVAVRRWQRLNSDLPALLDEWASSLFRELDYRAEAANGVRFRELYGHLEGVFVPQMVTDLTTRRVLVMEWVEGERLRTAYSAAADGEPGAGGGSQDDLRLVEVGVRCSLEQMLDAGFYHADPHPGNLLKTKDGRLAYLDFGMTGQVDESVRRGLISATLHLVNREYEALADDFVTLRMLPPDADKAEIVPALTGVFTEALRGGVNNLSFGDLSGNLGRTMYRFKFQIPSYYTLLVRSLSVLEGIALASDPNYKVLAAAYPFIARRLLTDTSPELRATLMALLYKNGKFDFARMESLLTQAARPTGRPQRRRGDAPGTAAPRGDALALLLSPPGEFIRGIVVEELAKGLDAGWRLAADSSVETAREQVALLAGAEAGLPGASAASAPFLHSLLDLLAVAPKLADQDDRRQVDGLQSLAAALQKATAAQREADQDRQKGRPPVTASGSWLKDPSLTGEATSGGAKGGAAGGASAAKDPAAGVLERLEMANELVQWALREGETLSADERAEALKLPLEIGQAVASRVVARAIRWLLAPDASGPAAPRKPAAAATAGAPTGRAAAAAAGSAQPRRPATQALRQERGSVAVGGRSMAAMRPAATLAARNVPYAPRQGSGGLPWPQGPALSRNAR